MKRLLLVAALSVGSAAQAAGGRYLELRLGPTFWPVVIAMGVLSLGLVLFLFFGFRSTNRLRQWGEK